MAILSIARDWRPNVCIVAITTTSSISEVFSTGWLALPDNQADIRRINNGHFTFKDNDSILIDFRDPLNPDNNTGSFFADIFPDFTSLNPITPIYPNLQNIVAHAGGGQIDATRLNLGINVITVVATQGDSVKLPINVAGQTVIVKNVGANPANIFPDLGGNINGGATNAPVSISPNTSLIFYGINSTSWATNINVSSIYPQTPNITAHAGGGQANGTLLSPGISIITTVVTAGDSATLPLNILGQTFIIRNLAANTVNIFPPLGANFYGSGTNISYDIPANTTILMIGTEPQRINATVI